MQVERNNGITKATMPWIPSSQKLFAKVKQLKFVTERLSDSPLPDRLTVWKREVHRGMSSGQREYLLNPDLPHSDFIEYVARAKCGLLRYQKTDALYCLSWSSEYFTDICKAGCNSTEIKFLMIASLNIDLESGNSHWLNIGEVASRLGVQPRCILACIASLDAKDPNLLDIIKSSGLRVHLSGVKQTTAKMGQAGVDKKAERKEKRRRNQPFCKAFEDAVGRKPSMPQIQKMEGMTDEQRAEYIQGLVQLRDGVDEFYDLHSHLSEAKRTAKNA
ncbi:hypothetical protein C6499_19200 [Candidatus Poribacteria bacterium]|nr:MAG: hypothetical protein C6499_19200 [Candidatus Poribacteria bacterium]